MMSIKKLQVVSATIALLVIGVVGFRFFLPDVAVSRDTYDYMTPELRARIEQLKSELVGQPTTDNNALRRAERLWDFANAYALDGGVIPADLTTILSSVRRSALNDDPQFTPRAKRGIDRFLRELIVKDEIPHAIGPVVLHRSGPLRALAWENIQQSYTVGALSMSEGGGVAFGMDGFNFIGDPQGMDPAANNFTSIKCSNPRARFRWDSAVRNSSLTTRVVGAYILEGTSLDRGDTITITYGDHTGGSQGVRIQGHAMDRTTFPIYLDLEGKGNFFTPKWPGIEVVGMEKVAAVKALGPSIVETGEPFDLSVRSEDYLYNRVSGSVPEYEVLLNGKRFASVPPSDNGLSVLRQIVIDQPGVHRFEVRSTTGDQSCRSNPIWVRDNPTHRIYWGDTHGHSMFDEGQGTPDQYFQFARDDARLDFVTLSNHDIWMDDYEWRVLQSKADQYNQPGTFVPILGYEWTVPLNLGGHHNVFFRNTNAKRVPAQTAPILERLYEGLRRNYTPNDVLTIPHAHNPGDWTKSDKDVERLVEITSVHGTFEFFGNRYLQNGWRVGFVGASDDHHGHPGYPAIVDTNFHTQRAGLAAVMTKDKTRNDIFSAMRDRKTYATGGERIIIEASLNGNAMGEEVDSTKTRRINCRVMGTAPVESIDVIKNGSVVYSHTGRHIRPQLQPNCWLRIGLASSTEVPDHRRPRSYRRWQGAIEIDGARIGRIDSPTFENRYLERAERDPESPRRIKFLTDTRGRMDAVFVELFDAAESTTVSVQVDDLRRSTAFPNGLPGADVEVRLGALTSEEFVHRLEDQSELSNQDTISLRLVDLDASYDQAFSYIDRDELTDGDYYYLRVRQIDGNLAWSSPWWVGSATGK